MLRSRSMPDYAVMILVPVGSFWEQSRRVQEAIRDADVVVQTNGYVIKDRYGGKTGYDEKMLDQVQRDGRDMTGDEE